MASITIPSLGIAMSDALLVKWLKQPGEDVAEGDAVAEIETDKALMPLESPVAGKLGPHLFAEEAIVPVGAVIVEVTAEGPDVGRDEVGPARPESVEPRLPARCRRRRLGTCLRRPMRPEDATPFLPGLGAWPESERKVLRTRGHPRPGGRSVSGN